MKGRQEILEAMSFKALEPTFDLGPMMTKLIFLTRVVQFLGQT